MGYDSMNGKETLVSSFGVHPILLAQPVRRASDSVARSAVVQRSGTGYVELKPGRWPRRRSQGLGLTQDKSGVQEGGRQADPAYIWTRWPRAREGTNIYIERAGKLRPLKQ